MTNQLELKPCPFCGSRAELKEVKHGFVIKCTEFDCQCTRSGSTRTSALKAWNTRAEPAAPSSDEVALERYGLQWNGPDTFVAQPMPDGYWTPWHIASAHIAALEASLNSAVSAHQVCLDEKNEKIAALEAENKRLGDALNGALGYMRNARIDLETGAPKRTAINTISGGIKLVEAALAQADGKAVRYD